MARDYSGLDPRSALGGTDISAVDSLWNSGEMTQVDHTIRQLQQGKQASYEDLDLATQLVQRGLRHPTHAMGSQELIEAMYHLNTTAEGQAHIVGNLFGPDNVALLRDLTASADSLLAKRLGSQGIQRLLEIAVNPVPSSRVESLIRWGREARMAALPRLYSDDGVLEREIEPTAPGAAPEFLKALEDNDIETLTAMISKATDVATLARAAAALGEQARISLSQLALAPDPQCRAFAVQALQLLAERNLDQEQDVQSEGRTAYTDVQRSSGQSAGAIIDAAALEGILSAPDSLPASLATDFGCSPALQASLLELILHS